MDSDDINAVVNTVNATADPSSTALWLGIAVSAFKGLVSVLATIIFTVVRLAIWPLHTLLAVLQIVFSPVIYTLDFVLSPVPYLFNIFPNIEPLYIYFGSAAFVGIIAGLVLQLTSSTFVSVLGLRQSQQQETVEYVKPQPIDGASGLEELSSQESDWPWLEQTSQSNIKRKRRTQGLLSQTILEEEDDS